jgi:hypothetical protein
MGAATVTGTVALMIQANRSRFDDAPPLTPNAIKAMLEYSATDLHPSDAGSYDLLTQGTGELDAVGATRLAASVDTRQPVGAFWLTGTVPAYSFIAGEQVAWSRRIVWGEQSVTGDVFAFDETAWAPHVVWGEHLVWGNHLVWGDNVVRDPSSVWS